MPGVRAEGAAARIADQYTQGLNDSKSDPVDHQGPGWRGCIFPIAAAAALSLVYWFTASSLFDGSLAAMLLPFVFVISLIAGPLLIMGAYVFVDRTRFRRRLNRMPGEFAVTGRRVSWESLELTERGTVILDCCSAGWPDYVAWYTDLDVEASAQEARVALPPAQDLANRGGREYFQALADFSWWCHTCLFDPACGIAKVIDVGVGEKARDNLKSRLLALTKRQPGIRFLESSSGIGQICQGERLPGSPNDEPR